MYGIYLFNLARINNCQLSLKLLFPITQQRQLKNSHNLNSLRWLTIYSWPDAMLINILVYNSLHEKKTHKGVRCRQRYLQPDTIVCSIIPFFLLHSTKHILLRTLKFSNWISKSIPLFTRTKCIFLWCCLIRVIVYGKHRGCRRHYSDNDVISNPGNLNHRPGTRSFNVSSFPFSINQTIITGFYKNIWKIRYVLTSM